VDQVQEYLTSSHGRLLMERNDSDVATCVSCHPAHDIRPPDDLESSVHPLHVADLCGSCHADQELMERREHTFDELRDYRASVHARLLYEEGDVSAPTCNDCHGNHGAAPPGIASVRNVCGQCHATMAEYFAAAGHVEPFDVDERPGCATCHGNHDIREADEETLTTRSIAICDDCHADAADPHGGEFLVMRAFIDSLSVAQERARAILEEAENRGMEVSQALFGLEDANNSLTLARSAVHSFHVGPVAEALQPGFEVTHAAWQSGLEALDEHRYRRVGLALSFAIILVLIVGLLLKIRESGSGRTEP
jgi:predicted CXXCH cytochrome family protein